MPPTVSTAEFWANVRCAGLCSRFLVCRLGSSGSAFLTKLLDSHPEVQCLQEGIVIQTYPRVALTWDDFARYAQWLSHDTQHEAYKVLGDVGSLALDFVLDAPAAHFRRGILIRHPLSVLKTKLSSFQSDRSDLEWYLPDQVTNRIRVDLDCLCEEDISFLWSSVQLAKLFEAAGRADVIIQAERLRDLEYCLNALRALTGLEYDSESVKQIIGQRINSRVPNDISNEEVFEGLTPQQQRWYGEIFGAMVATFGYELTEHRPSMFLETVDAL